MDYILLVPRQQSYFGLIAVFPLPNPNWLQRTKTCTRQDILNLPCDGAENGAADKNAICWAIYGSKPIGPDAQYFALVQWNVLYMHIGFALHVCMASHKLSCKATPQRQHIRGTKGHCVTNELCLDHVDTAQADNTYLCSQTLDLFVPDTRREVEAEMSMFKNDPSDGRGHSTYMCISLHCLLASIDGCQGKGINHAKVDHVAMQAASGALSLWVSKLDDYWRRGTLDKPRHDKDKQHGPIQTQKNQTLTCTLYIFNWICVKKCTLQPSLQICWQLGLAWLTKPMSTVHQHASLVSLPTLN